MVCRLTHGPERALEVARRGARWGQRRRARRAGRSQPAGDALQWNGRYQEAQREWLIAAAAKTPAEPQLLLTRTNASCAGSWSLRASPRTRVPREHARRAIVSAARCIDHQTMAEIHLGLLREADASVSELEAASSVATRSREALGLHAWVDALLHDEGRAGRIAAALASAEEAGFTPLRAWPAGCCAARRPLRRSGRAPERSSSTSPLPQLAPTVPRRTGGGCVRSAGGARAGARRRGFRAGGLDRSDALLAVAFRMRALTTGDLGDYELALEQHARWGNRFEQARTHLVYGEVLAARKRRKEAREHLAPRRPCSPQSARPRGRDGLGTSCGPRGAAAAEASSTLADRAGGSSRGPRRRRPVEQGDRGSARGEHEDGRGAPAKHLREARGHPRGRRSRGDSHASSAAAGCVDERRGPCGGSR